MRGTGEGRGAHISDPDLHGAKALIAQTHAVRANLFAG